ncbi:MAG: phosphatidylserine decarboxylase [Bdellovibrionales bacterium]|nr:phosphatidylserine decarboxylase [Bdellovibrionales bacterium]
MIPYFNRVTKTIETEHVYGGAYLNWAYQSRLGFYLTDKFFSKRWLSRIFGAFEDSALSRSRIKDFISRYGIDMRDFEAEDYFCFNDFFIRKFKAGKRPFSQADRDFCAGAEARYYVFPELKPRQKFDVKGIEIDLEELLRDSELAQEFVGGCMILARLCPVDYHRFHFPFSGLLTRHYRIAGGLHSVNPVAIEATPKVFLENERQVAVMEHPKFGRVAMIEVGALGVGKIVQSAYSGRSSMPLKFEKGLEKGYFLFGGSTVIWLLQKEKFKPSQDILENSSKGLETWVPLGQPLGELNE